MFVDVALPCYTGASIVSLKICRLQQVFKQKYQRCHRKYIDIKK